ncbi:hypothetical protein [Stappia sp.]|jgi:hypothetical protein|uniref:hypothetical protein n=1 Tax=Stappia sp. TaxID=1870903 RepID=UPI003A99B950
MSGFGASLRHGLTVFLLLAFALHAGGANLRASSLRSLEAPGATATEASATREVARGGPLRSCALQGKCVPYVAPGTPRLAPPERSARRHPRETGTLIALAEPALDNPPPRA